MAITSVNGILAGMQPPVFFSKQGPLFFTLARASSYWGSGGIPSTGTFNTTLNGGTYSSSSALVQGQIEHYDPAGGALAYLAKWQLISGDTGCFMLMDRLWDNGGISATSTSLQAITSPTWPARDANGQTNGVGVMLALEISAGMGAGTPTITVGYTNSSGTSGRTATNSTDLAITSAPTASWFRLQLQAGDVGVQSVQSIQLSSSWTSGTANLVAYRQLANLGVPQYSGQSLTPLNSGMPQLFNGTVPFIVGIPNQSGLTYISGFYVETQG